jgi:hypothetical protein
VIERDTASRKLGETGCEASSVTTR